MIEKNKDNYFGEVVSIEQRSGIPLSLHVRSTSSIFLVKNAFRVYVSVINVSRAVVNVSKTLELIIQLISLSVYTLKIDEGLKRRESDI